MKIILTSLLILVLLLNSCNNKKKESLQKKYQNDFFSTSSLFIHNNEEFIIEITDKIDIKNVEIFASVHRGYQDGISEIVKPLKTDGNKYKLLLSDSTISYITLTLFENENFVISQYYPFFKGNKPAKYSLTAFLKTEQVSMYDSLCDVYNTCDVDDPMHYIDKWVLLLNNNWLKDEIISDDLKKLETINDTTSTKEFVVYYGNKLLSHNSSIQEDSLFSVLNYNILNNMSSCALLRFITFNGMQPTQISILERIMSKYPLSYFTYLRIGDGTIFKIDQDSAKNILEKRLDYDPKDEKAQIYLAKIYFDHLKDYRTADSMCTGLYQKIQKKDYFSNISNPFYSLKNFKKLFITPLLLSRLEQKEYQNVVEFISQELNNYSATERYKSFLYETLGDAYLGLKKQEEAKISYLKSLKISPEKKVEEKLKNIANQTDFDNWLATNLRNVAIESRNLENIPAIFTLDSSFDISDNNDFVLLNFYETTCAPCLITIREIEKFKNSYSNLKVFYISPENIELTEGFIKKINPTNQVVVNSFQLLNYFENIAYPNTILIHQNKIIFEMGGGSNNLELTNKINEIISRAY